MTYGQFLRHCRQLAGAETKSDFARLLGYKDPDHYIGAENDKEGKEPSLDLLERAARAAGIQFHDCIQMPKVVSTPVSREDQKLLDQMLDLLHLGGEVGDWFRISIATFHKAYFRRR